MVKKQVSAALLAKRIELLEMQVKALKTIEPEILNKRIASIEDTLYTCKEILNMKEVCQYLDISQSLLYKLTCTGEIPHFKPRGKMIFFEKKELIEWIKNNRDGGSPNGNESSITESNDSIDNEKDLKKEQY